MAPKFVRLKKDRLTAELATSVAHMASRDPISKWTTRTLNRQQGGEPEFQNESLISNRKFEGPQKEAANHGRWVIIRGRHSQSTIAVGMYEKF